MTTVPFRKKTYDLPLWQNSVRAPTTPCPFTPTAATTAHMRTGQCLLCLHLFPAVSDVFARPGALHFKYRQHWRFAVWKATDVGV